MLLLNQEPMRVRVWTGDWGESLGDGALLEHVKVYVVLTKDGYVLSQTNAEKPPPQKELPRGAKVRVGKSWKIQLRNGKIVYGCQVHFKPVNLEPSIN